MWFLFGRRCLQFNLQPWENSSANEGKAYTNRSIARSRIPSGKARALSKRDGWEWGEEKDGTKWRFQAKTISLK